MNGWIQQCSQHGLYPQPAQSPVREIDVSSHACNSQCINDTGKEMRGGRDLILSEDVEESSRVSVFQEQRLLKRHFLDEEEGGYLPWVEEPWGAQHGVMKHPCVEGWLPTGQSCQSAAWGQDMGDCQAPKSKFMSFDIIPVSIKSSRVIVYAWLCNGRRHLLHFYSPLEFAKYVQTSIISFEPSWLFSVTYFFLHFMPQIFLEHLLSDRSWE